MSCATNRNLSPFQGKLAGRTGRPVLWSGHDHATFPKNEARETAEKCRAAIQGPVLELARWVPRGQASSLSYEKTDPADACQAGLSIRTGALPTVPGARHQSGLSGWCWGHDIGPVE